MVWALFYWNTRKSLYRLRGGRGQCPCQHPSDSGEPFHTGCEAILGWKRPERFRRVCPLLARNEAGRWVCSVAPARVRPFWGRAMGYAAAGLLMVALTAGIGTYGFFRVVGYPVSGRQVFWPPAWKELRLARAALFVKRAQTFYTMGRTHEAMLALGVAQELDPTNYETGMILAQFSQASGSPAVDETYTRLLRDHPEHTAEIARIWFSSLLARGQLEQVAALARRQLETASSEAAPWVNALIFSARKRQRPDWVDSSAQQATASPGAKAVLQLAEKVLRSPDPNQRRDFLVQTPLAENFSYDRLYRVEELIRNGFPIEALGLLGSSRERISGTDIARLTLAAYVAAAKPARVRAEFDSFLAPGRPLHAAELELLALHLVQDPNAELLGLVIGAEDRIDPEPVGAKAEALVAVFCAAGVQGNRVAMESVKEKLRLVLGTQMNAVNRLEAFFMHEDGEAHVERLLPGLFPLSTELNYLILDRY